MSTNSGNDTLPAGLEGRASSRPTVAIHTHGCKLNQADSQALAAGLVKRATGWWSRRRAPTLSC